MIQKKKTILGISPGTRHMGLALMTNGELIDWRVRTFSDKWSNQKLIMIISTIKQVVIRHGVSEIRFKEFSESNQSPYAKPILNAIRKYCLKEGINLKVFSMSEIKKQFRIQENENRKALTFKMAEIYPELLPELKKENENKQKYYEKIFEAVALLTTS